LQSPNSRTLRASATLTFPESSTSGITHGRTGSRKAVRNLRREHVKRIPTNELASAGGSCLDQLPMVRHSSKLMLCHRWLKVVFQSFRNIAGFTMNEDISSERQRACAAITSEALSLLEVMLKIDSELLRFMPGECVDNLTHDRVPQMTVASFRLCASFVQLCILLPCQSMSHSAPGLHNSGAETPLPHLDTSSRTRHKL
jgi:hypothetical protein